MSEIILPKINKHGKPKISYSQFLLWNEVKSFNLGKEGPIEYMVNYFFGHEFPDKGWAEFGRDVEEYITKREGADKFSDFELSVLNNISPLGSFQKEFEIDFGEFVLHGFIDDMDEYMDRIRDYKTASKSSSKKYREPEYYQLDFYAMYIEQQTGKIPEMEVCVIERKGNCMYGGGRGSLTVGGEVWYIPRETSVERMNNLKKDLLLTVGEISDFYKVFLNINK